MLPFLIYECKNLSIDFVIDLSLSVYKKDKNYNFILVIIEYLTKIVYYKPVKVTINALDLIEAIINVVVHYHRIFKSIIMD